jgi:competence protein ComEC
MAKIHFLNVGHGDCTIIEHNNGNLTVIDINNGSDDMDDESVGEIAEEAGMTLESTLWQYGLSSLSEAQMLKSAGYNIPLTNPIEFLKANYPGEEVFRYIQTHPDFDHLRGLAALRDNFTVLNFWDHPHSKEWDGKAQKRGDEESWDAYQEFRAGKHCKVLNLYRGAKGKYWNEGDNGGPGNGIHILSPTTAFRDECDGKEHWNDMSYVLEYRTGDRRIIFGGDAEGPAWGNILAHYGEGRLKCDVLKASHHGRNSGYHQPSVKAMSPEYTIVSVGKKNDHDASSKYRQYSDNVLSTRWMGDITLEIDGNEMTWTTSEERRKACASILTPYWRGLRQ